MFSYPMETTDVLQYDGRFAAGNCFAGNQFPLQTGSGNRGWSCGYGDGDFSGRKPKSTDSLHCAVYFGFDFAGTVTDKKEKQKR